MCWHGRDWRLGLRDRRGLRRGRAMVKGMNQAIATALADVTAAQQA
jgi:hypothetical protein